MQNERSNNSVPTLVPNPNGKTHPVAAMFPMMSEDELEELAADITANGLNQPIVLDPEGTLIDGRNRLAACQRAGVEPVYTLFDGQDPAAFIISNNVTRRHLTKGQQAMAIAKAGVFLKNSIRKLGENSGIQYSRIDLCKGSH